FEINVINGQDRAKILGEIANLNHLVHPVLVAPIDHGSNNVADMMKIPVDNRLRLTPIRGA
ncbi:MAG TPA: hypothetical protein VGY77_06825, partial [Gemmataceae bacterium]|nr:hypothetical protein [Gemmataceae bacterium]